MNKLKFEDFKNEVKNQIGNYLTEDYEDAKMTFSEVKKSGGANYDALMIRKAGEEKYSVIPALNLNEAFKKYEAGDEMDEVCRELADIRMHAPIPEGLSEGMLLDFEKVKDRIYPRLVNAETSKDYLIGRPHKDVEDLSVIYAIRINENNEGFSEAVIDDELTHMWGVDQDQIHEAAMANAEAHDPVFMGLEDAMFGIGEDDVPAFEPENMEESDSVPLYMLTNRQKTKGAVMALCSKFMDQITARFGEVYVLPSSVDEVLIMPKSATLGHDMALEDLARMVRQVNDEVVRPEDRLSDNVYEYDSETQSLKLAVVAPEQGAGIGLEM